MPAGTGRGEGGQGGAHGALAPGSARSWVGEPPQCWGDSQGWEGPGACAGGAE